MGNPFVRTKEQVEAMQNLISNGKFMHNCLRAEFETDEDFLAEVLPPCFEPPDKPIVVASIGKWQSHFCGEFDSSAIYMNCKYNGVEGSTMLALFTSGDMPVAIGREGWGEGKKEAISEIYRCGNKMYGFVERRGEKLYEINAELTEDIAPYTSVGPDFEIKAQPAANGIGLQHDPVLVEMEITSENLCERDGVGTLTFFEGRYDKLNAIPIKKVNKVFYIEGISTWSVQNMISLPDGDKYLPYIFGQKYDDLTQYHVADCFK